MIQLALCAHPNFKPQTPQSSSTFRHKMISWGPSQKELWGKTILYQNWKMEIARVCHYASSSRTTNHIHPCPALLIAEPSCGNCLISVILTWVNLEPLQVLLGLELKQKLHNSTCTDKDRLPGHIFNVDSICENQPSFEGTGLCLSLCICVCACV